MINLFLYNWKVRDEWFEWCKTVPDQEIMKERVGGMGSILHNLLHVINCERIWISQMEGSPVSTKEFNESTTLEEVMIFSEETKAITRCFLNSIEPFQKDKILTITSKRGSTYELPFQKVLFHIITHEVHHVGQLSVWAREIDQKPVSSDLIFREWQEQGRER
ncbi:DinB family protein [Bacillus sp. Marseille-Q1617]|uniref:DinB family protein n=1 Tax=Bacillus sp. Marseille-Q1617 TaxID=2736887 RepID=UPI00158BD436|nr:DinB family protein [Bacillus sp. Marseille-Q1617]